MRSENDKDKKNDSYYSIAFKFEGNNNVKYCARAEYMFKCIV